MRRTVTALAGLLLSGTLLTGCTELGTPTGPSTSVPQTARLTGRIVDWDIHNFTVQRDGLLVATLTWIYSNDMDLVLTDAACGTRDFYGCRILGSSRTRTPRGGSNFERIQAAVTRGQMLKFWIQNLDDATGGEYSLDVTVQ